MPFYDAPSARSYLVSISPGYTHAGIAKLNPTYVAALANVIETARSQGVKAYVSSAYRDPNQLWNQGQRTSAARFDKAGYSLHSLGAATDIGGLGEANSKAAKAFYAIATKGGIYNPYGVGNTKEFNHFQMIPQKVASAAARATTGKVDKDGNPLAWSAFGPTPPAAIPFPQGQKPAAPSVAFRPGARDPGPTGPIHDLQRQLQAAGFSVGKHGVDGIIGKDTTRAMQAANSAAAGAPVPSGPFAPGNPISSIGYGFNGPAGAPGARPVPTSTVGPDPLLNQTGDNAVVDAMGGQGSPSTFPSRLSKPWDNSGDGRGDRLRGDLTARPIDPSLLFASPSADHGGPMVGGSPPSSGPLGSSIHDIALAPPDPETMSRIERAAPPPGVNPADTVAGTPAYYRAEKAAGMATRFHPQQAEMERARHASNAAADAPYVPPSVHPDPNTFGEVRRRQEASAANAQSLADDTHPAYVRDARPAPKFWAGPGDGELSPPGDVSPPARRSDFFPQSQIDLARKGSAFPPLNGPANEMEMSNWLVHNFGSGAAPSGPDFNKGPSINDVIGNIAKVPGALWDKTFGSQPAAAEEAPAPSYPSFPPDHYGAGISSRPYNGSAHYMPGGRIVGSGGDDAMVGGGSDPLFMTATNGRTPVRTVPFSPAEERARAAGMKMWQPGAEYKDNMNWLAGLNTASINRDKLYSLHPQPSTNVEDRRDDPLQPWRSVNLDAPHAAPDAPPDSFPFSGSGSTDELRGAAGYDNLNLHKGDDGYVSVDPATLAPAGGDSPLSKSSPYDNGGSGPMAGAPVGSTMHPGQNGKDGFFSKKNVGGAIGGRGRQRTRPGRRLHRPHDRPGHRRRRRRLRYALCRPAPGRRLRQRQPWRLRLLRLDGNVPLGLPGLLRSWQRLLQLAVHAVRLHAPELRLKERRPHLCLPPER
jgi:hypothetical protein